MLKNRSQEKELLDLGSEYYQQDEYVQCLKNLFTINKIIGFFRRTVKVLKKISDDSTLLDVGCGGGLFILHLSRYFPYMPMYGVDISSAAIAEANENLKSWNKIKPNVRVSFQVQENKELKVVTGGVDLILVSLVCHHLTDDELVGFLSQLYLVANKAVIINELHRHTLSHFFYRLVSPLLFKNRLIKHDGLISIRRGFIRKEWQLLLEKAGIKNYQLKWCFPFCWQLILWK